MNAQFIAELVPPLLAMDRPAVRGMVESWRASLSPMEIAEKALTPALEEIGARWEQGAVSLAQVYMAGRICEEWMDALLPPGGPTRKNQPRMAIATLEDFHLLGRRMVWSAIRAAGYMLADYGRVTVDEVVAHAARDQIEVLLISTLMLPSALRVRDVRTGLQQRGLATKLVVGGAPFRFDRSLWQAVGADAMGYDASDALSLIDRWTEVRG